MEIIYGINSIRDLLRQNKDGWEKIIIASGRGGSSVKEIIEIARTKKIPVEFCERKYLDKLAGTTENQGVIALGQPFVYADLDVLIKNRKPPSNFDLILILDSIMDPQNLGSIIRTAHCMGANGVVIPEDRSANVTAAVSKYMKNVNIPGSGNCGRLQSFRRKRSANTGRQSGQSVANARLSEK